MMKKVLYLFLFLILLQVVFQYSVAQAARLILLENVNVVASGDSTRIDLKFDKGPGDNKITYREDFVQIEFSDAYVHPAKQWIEVEDGVVKNIFAYQFDDTTIRIRLFTYEKAENLKGRISLSPEDNKIAIHYKVLSAHENPPPHSPPAPTLSLPRLSYQGGGKKGGGEMEGPTESVAESLEKANTPPIITSSAIPEEKSLPLAGAGDSGLYGPFFKMIMVLGVMVSLLVGLLYLFKKFSWKKIGITDQNCSIRVVTSAYVGPKKSIALVDIGGERIVVGITPDHISFLTRLGREGEFKDILKGQIYTDNRVELCDELWEKV